ncbi:DNA uptake porin HofQ [Sodalis ligni]|uniref:DNA uptake porin HofQ n=1 Tax=Sodalis ligni TaxID=2697027 RepID=UPI00193F7EEC|nr:DNA uptake porin HofQ [Sodalis ligni]QWA11657.1 DNA uptake porin HofQ [Sodalis ligni]
MKGRRSIAGLLFLLLPIGLCAAESPAESSAGKGKPVTLVFDDAPIQQVLRALAEHQRLNLVVAPGIKGNISLNLHGVPWQQAVDLIVGSGRLHLERRGNVLLVYPAEQLAARQEQQAEAQRRRESEQPLSNRLVTLQHADAAEVAKNIGTLRKSLMSPRGTLVLDKRTNSLVLRDTDEALANVTDWIKIWDLPLEQVMITAHIVTISRDNLRNIGVDWQHSADMGRRTANMGVSLPLGEHYASMGFRLARLSGRLLELELTALEQENKVDILASPRLYTAHQRTASIKQGTELPYQMKKSKSKGSSIQFKEAVLKMEVTPKILRNGKVTLDLRLSQNVPGQMLKQGGNEGVSIDMEEIKTQVTIADGETIVLGGIFQRQKHETKDKIPLLADIPWLGHLFKRQQGHYKQRELVIFITPTRISG